MTSFSLLLIVSVYANIHTHRFISSSNSLSPKEINTLFVVISFHMNIIYVIKIYSFERNICVGKKFRLFLNFIRFMSFSSGILGLVSLAVLRYIQAVAYTCNLLVSLLYNIPPISQLMGMPPGALCKSFSSVCSPFPSN